MRDIPQMSTSDDMNQTAMRRGAVVGMFDGVHRGHLFLLDRLKKETRARGLSPAIFTFPAHPLSVVCPARAPRLLTEPAEKLSRITACGFHPSQVGFLIFDDSLREMTASQFMGVLHNRYGVDFILRGFDNRFGTERHLSSHDYKEIAATQGIELIDATSLCHGEGTNPPPVSSSRIREALAGGEIGRANLMLGYNYRLTGTVVDGKRLGRTLGFPTANLRPIHHSKLIPSEGVYFCMATAVGMLPHRAIVNIGTRPTVDGSNSRLSIEAHILDFDSDIYGTELTVEFVSRIRSEIRFPSTADLTLQLEADREIARNLPV